MCITSLSVCSSALLLLPPISFFSFHVDDESHQIPHDNLPYERSLALHFQVWF